MSLNMSERLALELPKMMRARPRDGRGYPIPYIVLIDTAGNPQFTINDVHRVKSCISKRLCAICGRRMNGDIWFVGGARCFMHEHGAFVDPPNHYECATYALRVCPFLAAPSYTKRIDDKKLDPANLPPGMAIARVEYMPPAQPEIFGLGHSEGYRLIESDHQGKLFRVDRWAYVEWWRDGVRVNAPASMSALQPMVRT